MADKVAVVTLNRPEKRNAINEEMRQELTALFSRMDADDDIRCVVLTGAGPVFCAGIDLTDAGPVLADPRSRPRVTAPLENFSKVVVAALNGSAIGGGLEMALACDIRIAVEGAFFSLPEVKIGSLSGSGGTQRLPLIAGVSVAAEMILTGEPIDSGRARDAGLVSELCTSEDLLEAALRRARRIAENAPLSVRGAKKVMGATVGAGLEQGLALERALFFDLAETYDRQEGRAAFRERRKPQFKGQ